MTEKRQVYKCDECGNIVEVLETGGGELICCGGPMALQEEKTEDATKEKHVPFIEKVEGGYKVRIGQNAAHPMEEKHYIQWIQLLCGDRSCRTMLKPGDAPEAFFACDDSCCPSAGIKAREYCNVHGLWQG